MVLEYYDDYDVCYSDNSQEEDDDEYYEEDEEEEYENLVDDNYEYDPIPPRAEWRDVRIGRSTFKVSSEGKVMFGTFNVTYGFREAGLPYRFVSIEFAPHDYRRYYVHDLVWRAFNGQGVPHGWEVRHLDYTPTDSSGCYYNNVEYLDVYEKTVERDVELE